MATADRAAVVSSIEELSDNSKLQEARSCEDEEFLLFLLGRVHSGAKFVEWIC